MVAGLGLYFGMASATYLYVRSTKPPSTCRHGKGDEEDECDASKAGGSCVFDQLSDQYDNKIGLDETLMGIKLLRWWLMRKAQVSCRCQNMSPFHLHAARSTPRNAAQL